MVFAFSPAVWKRPCPNCTHTGTTFQGQHCSSEALQSICNSSDLSQKRRCVCWSHILPQTESDTS